MKLLSLAQPFASLIVQSKISYALLDKNIQYTGPCLIHAKPEYNHQQCLKLHHSICLVKKTTKSGIIINALLDPLDILDDYPLDLVLGIANINSSIKELNKVRIQFNSQVQFDNKYEYISNKEFHDSNLNSYLSICPRCRTRSTIVSDGINYEVNCKCNYSYKLRNSTILNKKEVQDRILKYILQ